MKKESCTSCLGEGWLARNGGITCPDCDGSGVDRQYVRDLEQVVTKLRLLIENSGLIEVPATVVADDGLRHPVIKNSGTMLVHKDSRGQAQQRAKDLQAHATTARNLHKWKECAGRLAEQLESCFDFDPDLASPLDREVLQEYEKLLGESK